jgi:segregation and condensation protein A
MLQDAGFEIKLPQFEGPFDLLLFFIERDELDIHNIPIATITNDFLDYLRQMQSMNIELASEFILVAATLMRIKSKLLLPRYQVDEEGNEIDPRKDLIEQLIAYKKFKAAVEDMNFMAESRMQREARGNVAKELQSILANSSQADELHNLSLFKLLSTFEKVMNRFNSGENKFTHTVIQYAYTIEGQKSYITDLIDKNGSAAFVEMLYECKDKYQVVFTFLAILELLAEQVLTITIGSGFNNFWLKRLDPETADLLYEEE